MSIKELDGLAFNNAHRPDKIPPALLTELKALKDNGATFTECIRWLRDAGIHTSVTTLKSALDRCKPPLIAQLPLTNRERYKPVPPLIPGIPDYPPKENTSANEAEGGAKLVKTTGDTRTTPHVLKGSIEPSERDSTSEQLGEYNKAQVRARLVREVITDVDRIGFYLNQLDEMAEHAKTAYYAQFNSPDPEISSKAKPTQYLDIVNTIRKCAETRLRFAGAGQNENEAGAIRRMREELAQLSAEDLKELDRIASKVLPQVSSVPPKKQV